MTYNITFRPDRSEDESCGGHENQRRRWWAPWRRRLVFCTTPHRVITEMTLYSVDLVTSPLEEVNDDD